MRRRLVYYFERKNCLSPDDLADETLSRVARRSAEEGEIRDVTPAHYCYMVARFVFLEYQRHPASRQVSIQALPLLEDAAGMLPDHPKYPEVRRLKDRAFEALLGHARSIGITLPSTNAGGPSPRPIWRTKITENCNRWWYEVRK